MRNVFLASRWSAAALALALFVLTGNASADKEGQSKNNGGSGGARSSAGGGKSSVSGGGKVSAGGGGTPSVGGERKPNAVGGGKPAPGGAGKSSVSGGAKAVTGNGGKSNVNSGAKVGTGVGGTPSAVGGGKSNVTAGGKPGTNKAAGKADWSSWNKSGWNKEGWNSEFNSQHHHHHHGYWNNGIWIVPALIAYNQPWTYLRAQRPIVSGQKWLGATYEPYDGGGAYVTGIYEGSPAQRVGLEVGDVIVSLDGVDATNLGSVVQASDGNVVLQVLRGRTGALVQTRVNLFR